MASVQALRLWTARRWLVAAAAAVGIALLLGLPTDVIDNPVFGRSVAVTWWSVPVLVVSAVLGGLLAGTYIRVGRPTEPAAAEEEIDRPGKWGVFGTLVSFFAIGCPVCNKLVLLALGSTGAISWFAPLQPWLAAVSIALLGWALRVRLRGQLACPAVPVNERATT